MFVGQMELDFKSTKDIKIPKSIIDRVVGQEEAVEVAKKAASQRRHMLLIGEPGTGKSMIGIGLAELLPKEKLLDILSFQNPNDENQPLIRTVPAGKGREIATKARMQGMDVMKNQSIALFIIVLLVSFLPYYFWKSGGISDIIFAASMITGMVFIVGFMLFLNFARRPETRSGAPKVIVDNYGNKQAPFFDATGAHAGALLGDVMHDPFQTFLSTNKLQIVCGNELKTEKISEWVNTLMIKEHQNILTKNKKNYEAVHLPNNEQIILGEMDGSICPVEVLSCNRYDYDGKMVKLVTSSKKEVIITPEHKVALWENGIISYREAGDITIGNEIVVQSENIIIDELDLICTYGAWQQEQCRLYNDYQTIKAQNPTWGYKKIAKAMHQSIGKTRWWHAKKHIPVPLQTILWLKERGLLPLKIDNPKLPLLAKILGATFGDGGIFENLNGIFLSSSEREAVEEFGRDMELLFGLQKEQNSRIGEGGEMGHSWCYQNTNRNIIRFFLALGAPKGNKTKIELHIPHWIKLKKECEDEFYGSFLGSELGTPIINKRGNYLTCLEVGITGTPSLKQNRLFFLHELVTYLAKMRITTTSIYEGKTAEGSLIFRVLIEKKMDNVLLFLINLKVNYCTYKKNRLYTALGQWALKKKNKYHELIHRGYGAERAMRVLNLTPNSLYLLLNHFGEEAIA